MAQRPKSKRDAKSGRVINRIGKKRVKADSCKLQTSKVKKPKK